MDRRDAFETLSGGNSVVALHYVACPTDRRARSPKTEGRTFGTSPRKLITSGAKSRVLKIDVSRAVPSRDTRASVTTRCGRGRITRRILPRGVYARVSTTRTSAARGASPPRFLSTGGRTTAEDARQSTARSRPGVSYLATPL